MAETHLQTPLPYEMPAVLQQPEIGVEAINSQAIVNGIEQKGIAIEDKEGVAQSLDVLRSEFGIDDEILNQPKTQLVLGSIANRMNQTEKNPDLSFGQKAAEMEYVADLVMLTAGGHSQYADQYRQSLEENEESNERVKAAYDKFTQPELTREMDDFIRGEAFDGLRQRLGVTEEDPYEVRVLSIDSDENSSVAYGLVPSVDFADDSVPFENLSKENDARRDYLNGLKANGVAFNEMLGREGGFAPAWVATFDDGTKYLCLPSPTAEKVMYKDEERASHYTENDRLRDLAIIEHEYTHTQKMLLFDENVGVGIALEELRAEHFSGDKHGYTDIKRYFMGMRMLTGYTPKQSFEAEGQTYDEERFLTDIAKNIGLDGLLDTMATIPSNYAADEKANPYLKAVVAHNGGSLSAQFEKLYEHVKQQDGEEAVEQRISGFVDQLRDSLKGASISVESFLHYGGLSSLGKIGSENFRRRYPEESDNYDYERRKSMNEE